MSEERFTAAHILWAGVRRGILRGVTDAPAPGDADALPEGLTTYLEALASGAPTPGGGSAAGMAGALGAALVGMVANFTVGRSKFAAVDAALREVLAGAKMARELLTGLTQEDERAYATLSAAMKLPREDEAQRRARAQAMQQALRAATAPPLAMAAVCREVLDLAQRAAEQGNPALASDAGVAALLAEAALQASAINVRVNLARVRDQAFVDVTTAELNRLLYETPALKEAILAVASRRMSGD